MAFHFNFDLLKQHPYATGAVVIVGGIVVFYLLSSSSSSGTASASSNDSSELQADEQEAQVNAAAQVQNNATNAQLQAAQLAAQSADYQTSASLQANNVNVAAQLAATLDATNAGVSENNADIEAQTEQQGNTLVYAENLQSMQDSVLEDQINSGVVENANNNATDLAAQENTNATNLSAADTEIGAATTLAQGQEAQYSSEVQQIIPLAGQQKNSALDASDQTNLFAEILAGGNPSVGSAVVGGTTAADSSGNTSGVATTTAIAGSISSGLSSLASGLFG